MAKNKSYKPVFRIDKLTNDAEILGASQHNLRVKKPKNADSNRTIWNEVIIGAGQNILALVNNRIKKCEVKVRKNAVKAWEILLTAGPQFFKNIQSRKDWQDAAIALLRREFGAENLVHVIVHEDESTLHMHAIVVPLVEKRNKSGEPQATPGWKLDSKGILEKWAHKRPLGQLDRAASEILVGDFKYPAKFIRHLLEETDPLSVFLTSKMSPKALGFLQDREILVVEKREILAAELNKILDGPAFYSGPLFANVQLSADTQHLIAGHPQGADLVRLHRMLLVDAFPGWVKPLVRRPIGSPTAPYMHELQVYYYDLCKKLDPKISEPLYRSKIDHVRLAEYFARVEQAVSMISEMPEIKISPPGRYDLNTLDAPDKYATRQNELIREAMRPVKNALLETLQLRHDLEQSQNAISIAQKFNASVVKSSNADIEELRRQRDGLTLQNSELLTQLRAIPLADVMTKLGFPHQIPGEENQFRLPDDRIIKISGDDFSEINGRYGLGKMNNRKSATGAIDLVMFITGWELLTTRHWMINAFGRDMTVSAIAEKARADAAEDLIPAKTAAEVDVIQDPAGAFYQPNETKWPPLRNRLINDFRFDAGTIDDLYRLKKIHANQFSSLVCNQNNHEGKLSAALVQSVKSPADRGTIFEINLLPKPYPFEIGEPTAENWVLVATPLDAISYYVSHGRDCRVFATRTVPPPELLFVMKQRAAETNRSMILANEFSEDGNALANVLEAGFAQVQIPTMRQNSIPEIIRPAVSPAVNKPGRMPALTPKRALIKKADRRARIQALVEIAARWQPNEDAWTIVLDKLVRKYWLSREDLTSFRNLNLICAPSNSTLAVARTDLDGYSNSPRGLTIMDIDQPVLSPQILLPDQGGVFWTGRKLAKANVIVGVANPLEALSYRAINLLDPEPLNPEQPEIAKPLIISLDGDLPSPALLKLIEVTGKAFWLATNTALNVEQIAQIFPHLLNPSKDKLADWFNPRPARSTILDGERDRVWSDLLAEKMQARLNQPRMPK